MRVDKLNYSNFRQNNLNPVASNPISLKTSNNIKDTFIKSNAISFKATIDEFYSYEEEEKEMIADFLEHLLNDENFHLVLQFGTDPYCSDDPNEYNLVWGKTDLGDRESIIARKKDLDLLSMSEEEIKKIADALCLYKQYDVAQFCKYPNKVLGISIGTDKEATMAAFKRLYKYIQEDKEEIKKAIYIIHNFEEIKVGMLADITKQKEILSSALINPVKMQAEGVEAKVPNGILIYGSNNSGKQEIVSWIRKSSGLRVRNAKFNAKNPQQSIDDFKYRLEEAENVYQKTKVRTVLELNNFDELLTNCKTSKERRMIAQFKNISEQASQKYHTTLLLTTDKPLEKFEPSSIATHRFDISLLMDEKELTAMQNKMYQDAMDKLYYYVKEGKNFSKNYVDITINHYTGGNLADYFPDISY